MDTGLLIVRLVVGLTLAGHGVQKLFGWFEGPGLSGTATRFEGKGYQPGRWFAAAAALAEAIGGLLLAIGLLMPLTTAVVIADMVAAALSTHATNGFWLTKGGYEYTLVLGGVAAGLAFTGAGGYSVDHLLGWNLGGIWWGELSLALAIAASMVIEVYRHQRLARPRAVA
jgi:putative oxidoreductase